jgi:hypothetical protein
MSEWPLFILSTAGLFFVLEAFSVYALNVSCAGLCPLHLFSSIVLFVEFFFEKKMREVLCAALSDV